MFGELDTPCDHGCDKCRVDRFFMFAADDWTLTGCVKTETGTELEGIM